MPVVETKEFRIIIPKKNLAQGTLEDKVLIVREPSPIVQKRIWVVPQTYAQDWAHDLESYSQFKFSQTGFDLEDLKLLFDQKISTPKRIPLIIDYYTGFPGGHLNLSSQYNAAAWVSAQELRDRAYLKDHRFEAPTKEALLKYFRDHHEAQKKLYVAARA